jgi:hypothetical protein
MIVKAGIVLPEAGEQATRQNIIQTAKQAEEEGFDSFTLICIVVSRVTTLFFRSLNVTVVIRTPSALAFAAATVCFVVVRYYV